MPTAVAPAHAFAGQRPTYEGLVQRILTMLSLRRSRQDLAHLSDDQLGDIGLTREQVTHEIARPIWDVPTTWRR